MIETPTGEILIGKGLTPDLAYQQAMDNLVLSKTPKKGPGMWEESIRETLGK